MPGFLRYASRMGKNSVWILWFGLAFMAALGSDWVAAVGRWGFGLLLLAHLAEFFVKRSVLERAGGSMGHHFVQTLIYGLFHWKPIEERQQAEASS